MVYTAIFSHQKWNMGVIGTKIICIVFLIFFLIFAHLWCGVLGFSVDGILGHLGGWGDFGFLGIGALYMNLEE